LKDTSLSRFTQLLLWGDSGLGKSHLLQAFCNQAHMAQKTVFYVPLKTLAAYGSGVLSGMERFDALVIDDVDRVLGDVTWEETLYGLINERHYRKQQLILATSSNPKTLICELDDLVQKLKWGVAYHLEPIPNSELLKALKWIGLQRGFELADNVLEFILKRYPHNIACLSLVLEYLDRVSLRAGRKITRSFVQQVLQDFQCQSIKKSSS
jgi:DnaA family protein